MGNKLLLIRTTWLIRKQNAQHEHSLGKENIWSNKTKNFNHLKQKQTHDQELIQYQISVSFTGKLPGDGRAAQSNMKQIDLLT